jgi:LPS export ABC transporter protein LptC
MTRIFFKNLLKGQVSGQLSVVRKALLISSLLRKGLCRSSVAPHNSPLTPHTDPCSDIEINIARFSLTPYLRIAAFVLVCFFFSACENDPKVIEEWTRNKVMVEEAENIQTFFSQGSRMRAKLWSPYMLRNQSDTQFVEFPKTLHVDFFDSTGKVESHLDALYGKYYESLKKVYLRDSVLVYNMQGDTLRCPDLWWDQNGQKFYTDKAVRIRKGGDLYFGNGMEAKQDLTEVHIKQIKQSTIQVPDSLQVR